MVPYDGSQISFKHGPDANNDRVGFLDVLLHINTGPGRLGVREAVYRIAVDRGNTGLAGFF